MSACPRCGKPVSAWTRDLSSGLCNESVQAKAKEDAEERARAEARTEAQRQEVAKSIERLQKLHAEGALTDEEFQQLEAVRKSTAAPGPPSRYSAKKIVAGIAALVVAVVGVIKGCVEYQKRANVGAEKQQQLDREKRAAKHQEASRKELQRLKGTWLLVSEETSGKEAKEDPDRRLTIESVSDFRADSLPPHVPKASAGVWTLRDKKGSERGFIRFPEDNDTPNSIDLVRTRKTVAVQNLKGQTAYVHDNTQVTYLGIISMEGDTLRLCHSDGKGKERPREFGTKQGDGFTYSVWQRSKK